MLREVGHTRDERRGIFRVFQEWVFDRLMALGAIRSGDKIVDITRITVECEIFELVLAYQPHVHPGVVVRGVVCAIQAPPSSVYISSARGIRIGGEYPYPKYLELRGPVLIHRKRS